MMASNQILTANFAYLVVEKTVVDQATVQHQIPASVKPATSLHMKALAELSAIAVKTAIVQLRMTAVADLDTPKTNKANVFLNAIRPVVLEAVLRLIPARAVQTLTMIHTFTLRLLGSGPYIL